MFQMESSRMWGWIASIYPTTQLVGVLYQVKLLLFPQTPTATVTASELKLYPYMIKYSKGTKLLLRGG